MRNEWAHLSGGVVPPSEIYRDADTLGRLLAIIGAEPASLDGGRVRPRPPPWRPWLALDTLRRCRH